MRNGFKWSDSECREKARRFKDTYESAAAFKKYIDAQAESGAIIRNVMGRPFHFPNQEEIFMKCFNTLIQSSASDLVLNSAYKIQKEFNERGISGNILLLVHDEIVIEIPEDQTWACEEIITRNMTSYDLQTSLGPIKLEVEGAIESFWKK
jgi:DNA polymerase-1